LIGSSPPQAPRSTGDGVALTEHTIDFRTLYNSIRPHEAIGMARPLERYRHKPQVNIPDPGLSHILDTYTTAL
jgi:hypothetical protein